MLIASPFVDHLVELSLVNSVLEADLCAPLLADQTKATSDEKKAVLLPIIDAANDADNNLFLIPEDVEKFVSWEIILSDRDRNYLTQSLEG